MAAWCSYYFECCIYAVLVHYQFTLHGEHYLLGSHNLAADTLSGNNLPLFHSTDLFTGHERAAQMDIKSLDRAMEVWLTNRLAPSTRRVIVAGINKYLHESLQKTESSTSASIRNLTLLLCNCIYVADISMSYNTITYCCHMLLLYDSCKYAVALHPPQWLIWLNCNRYCGVSKSQKRLTQTHKLTVNISPSCQKFYTD